MKLPRSLQCSAWTLTLIVVLLVSSFRVTAALQLNAVERGDQRSGISAIWHDPAGEASLADALKAWEEGQFKPLETAGSTGLSPGAFWSVFSLENPGTRALPVRLEYVDHQLIELQAWARDTVPENAFRSVADLSLRRPFSHRPVSHNRFVIPLRIEPGQTLDVMVRFGSDEAGFVFPSLRVWTEDALRHQQSLETGLVGFLLGGFLLMALFAGVTGMASGERIFLAYALYSFSKVTVWATILGYTHQYFVQNHFHWKMMSVSGAVTIFCGLVFARMFLQSREFLPRLDWLLKGMMLNALLLAAAALAEIKILALITVTLALLLYPVLTLAGLLRWRQGSTEAAVFALAWSFLVCGLVVQALRDLGVVAHTPINYFWPPVASFTEMLTIMFAMGLRLRYLRRDKEKAQTRYRAYLEDSKAELERLVTERTRDLEQAKQLAELEARTDHLTGIRNRRSFFQDARKLMQRASRNDQEVVLLMFDIDHFKTVNDRFGHSVGDEALRAFASVVLEHIRVTDIVGRLGGEEFALLVTSDLETARNLAERLRRDIATLEQETPAGKLEMTTSIGLALATAQTGIDELVHQADQALYLAKRDGRNCVRVWPDDAPSQEDFADSEPL